MITALFISEASNALIQRETFLMVELQTLQKGMSLCLTPKPNRNVVLLSTSILPVTFLKRASVFTQHPWENLPI